MPEKQTIHGQAKRISKSITSDIKEMFSDFSGGGDSDIYSLTRKQGLTVFSSDREFQPPSRKISSRFNNG